jgi:hypothetical protein
VAANTPEPNEKAVPQSLTATTSTTKTPSGSGGSIATYHQPPSTDLTSIRSLGFSLDKKCLEQNDGQPQERPRSSTSMRATDGSDTGSGSESDKSKKKEQMEWKWNTNALGSQFCDDDPQPSSRHAKGKRRREVVLYYPDRRG